MFLLLACEAPDHYRREGCQLVKSFRGWSYDFVQFSSVWLFTRMRLDEFILP
jgi:hypothetical protein